MIEHRALVNYALAAADKYRITAADRVLQFASASYDAHVEELYPCWARGATLVLRNDEMLDCKRFLDLCDEWRLSFVTLPTAFWHELTAAIEAEKLVVPATLRTLVIGGEQALPQRVAAWFDCVGQRVRLLNTYGPTETTVVATGTGAEPRRRPPGAVADRPAAGERAGLRAGCPAAAGAHRRAGRAVHRRREPRPGLPEPPGIDGAAFRGRSVCRPARARMYNTGDVVRWRPDGQLEFLGRHGPTGEDSRVPHRARRGGAGAVRASGGGRGGRSGPPADARQRATGGLRVRPRRYAARGGAVAALPGPTAARIHDSRGIRHFRRAAHDKQREDRSPRAATAGVGRSRPRSRRRAAHRHPAAACGDLVRAAGHRSRGAPTTTSSTWAATRFWPCGLCRACGRPSPWSCR